MKMKKLQVLDKKIKANPHYLPAWHEKIEIFIEALDNEAILKTYDEMLANNPAYSEALIGKAHWLELMMKKPEEALKCFAKAAALDPENKEALSNEMRMKNEKIKRKN